MKMTYRPYPPTCMTTDCLILGEKVKIFETLRNFNVPSPGCKSNCKPTLPKIFQLLHLEKYTSETSFENEKVRNQVAFLLI